MWKEVKFRMPRMKDLDIDFISLVNKGANKQTVKIYKSDDEPVNDEEFRGFFNVMKSFFTKDKKEKTTEIETHKMEEEEMKAEDIKKMLDDALAPIKEELKVLKGDEIPAVEGEECTKGQEEPTEPTQEEIIAKAIEEATASLKEEITELKKSRKAPQSLTPGAEGQEIKKSYIGAFESMFN